MEEQKVIEDIVEFKAITDKVVWGVCSEETKESMVEISGYDLDISFNMDYIKSVEDIEACISGVGEVFRKLLLERVLSSKTTG